MPSSLHAPRYTAVKLCTGKGAYEAVPVPPGRVDLGRVAQALAATGIEVTDARVMLIVPLGPEVTLSRDGRVLVKTRDPAVAERALHELWRRIAQGSRRPG